MANFYKSLDASNDVVSTRTLLHEAIPLTGTIVSGTYADQNIKNYAHGMFQSVYDYPYLSSSANHIFDITVGVSPSSHLYEHITNQKSKKANIYNQMAQVCMGYDNTGSIQLFDADGDLVAGGDKIREAYFLNFSRLLSKDEIKKGTFQMTIGVNEEFHWHQGQFASALTITDASGSDGYYVNSPVGEYGVLYATGSSGASPGITQDNRSYPVGLLFYQAGIAVLSGSIFMNEDAGGILSGSTRSGVDPDGPFGVNTTQVLTMSADIGAGGDIRAMLTGSSITGSANSLRNRIQNIQFNNTVELNSSVYFCRVNHNQFNYSANPTYLSNSKIRVKTDSTDDPVAYITTVGLYNDNNELMATAKLSEPLKKSPDTEFTIRVRLDY